MLNDSEIRDFAELVRRQFIEGSVWQTRETVNAHDEVLVHLNASAEARWIVVREMKPMLLSSDVRVRTGAVAILHAVVADVGPDVVASALMEAESLYRGVKPAWPIGGGDLEEVAAGVLASSVRLEDLEALAYLRRLVAQRAWGGRLDARLTRIGPPASGALRPPRLDWARREVTFTVAYCGPPLAGRLTSMTTIHRDAASDTRSALVAKDEEHDRSCAFDFVPVGRAPARGLGLRLRLVTIPAPRFDDPRLLGPVLAAAQGIVFVVDCTPARFFANAQHLSLLDTQLARLGRSFATTPHVWQLNKRDLPSAFPVDEVVRRLAIDGAPTIESSATDGWGVHEALDVLTSHLVASFELGQRPA